MHFSKNIIIAGAFAMACLPQSSLPSVAQTNPVVLTFSTLGDSRQDPVTFDKASVGETLSGQDAKFLQNTRAFARILSSIQAQKSKLLFFNGDMIHGYGIAGIGYTSSFDQSQINGSKGNSVAPIGPSTTADIVKSDLLRFYQQYAFWRGMVAPLMEAGTYIVPVPGNHETQCKPCGKVARQENEDAWAHNMGDLIVDTTRYMGMMGEAPANVKLGPTPGNSPDGLTTDQSKLSYSFDAKGAHFAVINTDAVGKDSMAPTKWLAADFEAAKARGIKRFFVFGHKPAYTYNYVANGKAELSGLDAVPANIAARDAFWDVIEDYQATYFAGHEHVYNVSQPRGKAYQVIVGSGGSPFEAKAGSPLRNPATDRTYAWATINLYQDASADIITYGFDENFGETRELQKIGLR